VGASDDLVAAVVGYLERDGHGTNYAKVVGFRRGRDGHPEFFVDQDPPDPEPLDPDSGPYEWRAARP
jgi:hypothetical protein